MKRKEADAKARAHFSRRGGQAPPTNPPRAASVNLDDFEPSLHLLNSLAIWQGRVRFGAIKRRGSMIIGITDGGCEIVFPTAADLGSFARAQAVVADATSIWIDTPPHRMIRAMWEPAVSLMLRLSNADGIRLESPLKEEIHELLKVLWQAGGKPASENSQSFIDYMRLIQRARRDPAAERIPPVVFVAEGYVWTHVPGLQRWASIPAISNRVYAVNDVRNGLLLLAFEYFKNLSRGFDGDSECLSLWRGPAEVLE